MIIEMLKKEPKLTLAEIGTKVYHRKVEVGSNEYSAISRSIRSLKRKGIVDRLPAEVRWRLNEPKREKNERIPSKK